MSAEAGEVLDTEKDMSPEEIVQGLKSADLAVQIVAARACRRMLSRDQNSAISIMFEAAWALTNIASGTHDDTMEVINGGAIPKLVSLLARGGVVGEQSAWALGNIAGDGAAPRDAVLAHGALPALLPHLTPDTVPSQLRTAAWTLCRLCGDKDPQVKFELVAPALPYVAELLTVADQEVLANTCKALLYITDATNERIEEVQNTKHLLPRLVKLLQHKSPAVHTPVLRTVCNMLTGSDAQTDRCLEAGCLDHLVALMQCGNPFFVKEAALAVRNVLTGSQTQIQMAIDKGLLQSLVSVLKTEDTECRKALMSAGFFKPYCDILASPDQRAVIAVLDGLTQMMKVAAGKFYYVQAELYEQMEAVGAASRIESLQDHENEEIYEKAFHIMDNYLSDPEDPRNQP